MDYNITRTDGTEVFDQRIAKYVGACAEGVMNYAIMSFSPYARLISGSRRVDGDHRIYGLGTRMSDIPYE
jgi:hypothetical protein